MLSYDWTALTTMVADLKALVGQDLNGRLTKVEGVSAPDLTPLNARLDALEAAVSALSAQLALYPSAQKATVEQPAQQLPSDQPPQ